jgi:hypothetical protein
MPNLARHLYAAIFLILLTSITFISTANATDENSPAQTESLSPESSEGECSCNVRKRQQVEKRLNDKKKSEPDS